MSEADRIARLEERLAWLERHVGEQDKAMLELSDEVGRLRAETSALRERPGGTTLGEGGHALQDERPPHY